MRIAAASYRLERLAVKRNLLLGFFTTPHNFLHFCNASSDECFAFTSKSPLINLSILLLLSFFLSFLNANNLDLNTKHQQKFIRSYSINKKQNVFVSRSSSSRRRERKEESEEVPMAFAFRNLWWQGKRKGKLGVRLLQNRTEEEIFSVSFSYLLSIFVTDLLFYRQRNRSEVKGARAFNGLCYPLLLQHF